MVVGGRVTFLIGGRKFRAEPSLVFHSYRKPVKLGTQNPVKVDSVSIQSGTVSASVFFFHPTISLQKKQTKENQKRARAVFFFHQPSPGQVFTEFFYWVSSGGRDVIRFFFRPRNGFTESLSSLYQ